MILLVQIYLANPHAGVQLLDSSGCALRTDRCQTAVAAAVRNWHERNSPVTAPVPVWLPQQCVEGKPKPSLLRAAGHMGLVSGNCPMCSLLLYCLCSQPDCHSNTSCVAGVLIHAQIPHCLALLPQSYYARKQSVISAMQPVYVHSLAYGSSLLLSGIIWLMYIMLSHVMYLMHNIISCFMQAAVLMCQTMWGPRWFVPKRFLPAKYDYHRPVVPREVAEGILDSSSAPVDVETGDGGEHSIALKQSQHHSLLLCYRCCHS